MGENPFDFIPLTYHIQEGSADGQFLEFEGKFKEEKGQNVWIVKPGENTNRGNGITVCKELNQIVSLVDSNVKLNNGRGRSFFIWG